MERRIARGLSVLIIAALAIGLLAVFVAFVLPPLTAQMNHFLQNLPEFRARILDRIPARYPAIHRLIRELFDSPSSPKVAGSVDKWFLWGQSAVSDVVLAVVVLVLTLYLLLHGKSLYAWMLAFVPRTYREKLATTMHEVSEVIHAYVSGQLLAALLFAIFTAVLLSILRVPAVAPLAIIAGLCDVIPVLGILLATVPAVLLALAVSPAAALTVRWPTLAITFSKLIFSCHASMATNSKYLACPCSLRFSSGAGCKGSSAPFWYCLSWPPAPSSSATGSGISFGSRSQGSQGAGQSRRDRQRGRHQRRTPRREARLRGLGSPGVTRT